MASPVVLVTGALTGIGRATALAFAEQGATVAVSGRHADAYTRVAGSEENKAMLVAGIPQGRAGGPGEVAAAIVFMAADNASYLTGQTIYLGGGVTAS